VASAFVFPGQGSQYCGMLRDYGAHPQVALAVEEASDALGLDLAALCAADADPAALNDTANTQPALLALSVGIFRAWFTEGGARPAVMGGHSLGEYSALVCGRSLELAEAARLVRARGEAMKAAVPSGRKFGMRAVIGLSASQVAEACAAHEGAHVVNLNSPIQTVVAGPEESLEPAAALLREAGAKKIVPLAVSVPSHCPWMEPAVGPFGERLEESAFATPEIPVVQNATLEPAGAPGDIRAALRAQLVSPVDWVAMVMRLYRDADRFVECGPSSVLTGLNKRIAKSAASASLSSSERLAELANE